MKLFRTLLLLFVAVSCQTAEAQSEDVTGVDAYDQYKNRFREILVRQWELRIKEQEAAVKKARGAQEKKNANDILKELKHNNPPYINFGSLPHWDEGDAQQADWKRTWKVGDVGECSGSIGVVQIIDDETMLCWVHVRQNPWVMLKGFSTAGLVDDGIVEIADPMHVTGTTTYETAVGGTRTVLIVEPVDLSLLRSENVDSAPPKKKSEPVKRKSTKSLSQLRKDVISAEASARALMEREKFSADDLEYVALYVNRGSDSVDGTKDKLLDFEEIQAWIAAEREYVRKRDASKKR
jgi:hypothetical protein